MRICFISDTHNKLSEVNLPEADVLVHSGDALVYGDLKELSKFNYDLMQQADKFSHIIYIFGNHDRIWENNFSLAHSILDRRVICLNDKEKVIDGVKFYGAAWTPRFFDWSFMLNRGEELKRKWDLIPEDTSILITHGPSYGILDGVPRSMEYYGLDSIEHVGCEELAKAIERIQMPIHASGHIHNTRNSLKKVWDSGKETLFINASICDEAYRAVNKPFLVDYDIANEKAVIVSS